MDCLYVGPCQASEKRGPVRLCTLPPMTSVIHYSTRRHIRQSPRSKPTPLWALPHCLPLTPASNHVPGEGQEASPATFFGRS